MADPHGLAFSWVDLRTVLVHELGHVLGLDDHTAPRNVMSETLLAWVCRTVEPAWSDELEAGIPAFGQEAGRPSPPGLGRAPVTVGAAAATLAHCVAATQQRPLIDWDDDVPVPLPPHSQLACTPRFWLERFLQRVGVEPEEEELAVVLPEAREM